MRGLMPHMQVSHGGETKVFDFAGQNAAEAFYVAFYADCLHEVKPTTSGVGGFMESLSDAGWHHMKNRTVVRDRTVLYKQTHDPRAQGLHKTLKLLASHFTLAGYRLCLIYNLCTTGAGPVPALADTAPAAQKVLQAVSSWDQACHQPRGPPLQDPPGMLMYMLQHK